MKNCLDVFAGSYSSIEIGRRIRSVPLPYCRRPNTYYPVSWSSARFSSSWSSRRSVVISSFSIWLHLISTVTLLLLVLIRPLPHLEVGNLHDLRLGEMEDGLDTLGLLVLQIEQDFRLGVVDDALAVLAVLQGEEVV